MSRVKQWPQDAYVRDRPDSSSDADDSAGLNLEGNCRVRYTRRLRLQARPLRAARPTGPHCPVANHSDLRGLNCRLTSPQAGPFISKTKGGTMPKSRRYPITELPGTLQ